jgi:hypothetical protein
MSTDSGDDLVVEGEQEDIDTISLALLDELVHQTKRIADTLERLVPPARSPVPRPRVHTPVRPPEDPHGEEWPS